MVEETEEKPSESSSEQARPTRTGPWFTMAGTHLKPCLVIAFSVASFLLAAFLLLIADAPEQFFLTNRVPVGERILALSVAWIGGLVAGGASGFWLRSEAGEGGRLHRLASLLAPLSVSSFVPVVFLREAWEGREIAFLLFVLALGLATERLTRASLLVISGSRVLATHRGRLEGWGQLAWVKHIPLAFVVCLIAFYFVRVGTLTNISHMKLMTMSSDLAEYDNLFFNALNGHPFRSPAIAGHLEDFSTLQGHAEFGLYLLLPFYAISPGAHALLWIQTGVVGLTALPIFLLGKERVGAIGGLAFSLAFFFMPAVQQPNFYDFHFTPLAMFFVAWLLYFVALLHRRPESRKVRGLVYSSLALCLLCREDISMGTAILGAYLVLTRSLVRDGLIIGAASTVYFVFMKFTFMPLFGTWWFDNMYEDLKAEGAKGFGAIVLTLVSNPAFVLRTMFTEPKFLYVLHMTVPVLALWLRRPLLWLAFLPGLVATLLVTNRPPMFQASFQYTYLWIPYVVGASIVATRRGLAGGGTFVALVLVGLSLTNQMGVFPKGDRILGGFVVKTFEMNERDAKRYADLREMIAKIPRDATVGVTEAEGPHVSNRLVMYSLKYTLGPFPEYLLVSHPRHRGERDHVRKALDSGKYGVIAQEGDFTLAKRGADPKKNGPLWRKVGGRPSKARLPRGGDGQQRAKPRR